ncbi:hypothetical protein PAHAL_9G542000 [Panicum hallii]|uniref:non-specific serine/threonine protein kinase n=1 Tax=Panicum hallii TaxID=206008 RepID=A0A2S3ISP4_9POAL|nr:proline-rich receptor-like protein kinase PERK5 [Panicum hallii]PAN50732.1 hypothetical protein PAHAL_9G542000 [Panicum hallii]
MASPLDNMLGASAGSDDSSGSPSPPSDDTSSPPPSSSPPSTPSAPPSNSSGSGSPPPSPPSPSQPAASLSPPTATPQNSSALSPPAPADRGLPAAPSRDSPSTPAAKRGGGDSDKSGHSKSGSSRNGAPPVAAIVAGVVIGVLAFGLLMCIAACVCCARRRKRKKPPHMNMPYYTDQHGNVFYANSMPKWKNSTAMMDHGGGWHAPYSPGSGNTTSGSHGPGQMPSSSSPGMPSLGFSKSSFSYDELASATGGFASGNVLGQGGFGYVYKGVLPGSGKEVAVKQLKAGSGQGEREFQAEVEIISRVHHRHLVSLVGYCIAGSSQRLLVYEFVPNKTLEYHLHGKGVPVMNWPTRLAIALGSAKGLAYLHEDCHPRIIHRDIKAANILLDENFEAKVADFGLAKLTTDTNTHVSTRVMGTFGYLAPEYASSGKLTDKSDVFSFGVMLLELITGKRPVDPTNYMEDSLVDWARPLLARALSEGGTFDELLDPRLENNVDRLELERMCAAAAAAVRHSAKRRPKMKQIVRALEGDALLDDLNEGVKPGQSMMFSSSSEYDAGGGNYTSDMSRFRKVAFESGEYSNEYGATSESGEAVATRRQQHH